VDQVELFFDRELAICLRQVSSSRGHPIRRTELTGLSTATVDQAGFDYEPPPGKTVITRGAVGGPARGGLPSDATRRVIVHRSVLDVAAWRGGVFAGFPAESRYP